VLVNNTETRGVHEMNRLFSWLEFYSMLSTRIVAISSESLKFISKANDMYTRNYLFRMNIIEDIFQIRMVQIQINAETKHMHLAM